jgi:spore coat protein A
VRPPQPNEAGWKDTAVMYPGQVTRIVVRYAPTDKAINDPDLYFPFEPCPDNTGFVWHCHIIDHEDNEMMRPLRVIPKTGITR